MRRGVWGAAVAGVVVFVLALAPARGANLIEPGSVDGNRDVSLSVLPGDTSTMTDVTVIVPVGFRVRACPSSTFACSFSAHNASQETSVHWTRQGGSGATRQPDDLFAIDVLTPATGGNYTFTVAINDSVNGGRSQEVVIAVKGSAAAATTTTTARSAAPTSTTIAAPGVATTTTSTTEAATTTESTSEVVVERSSETTTTTAAPTRAIAPVDDDDDTDTTVPFLVGVVALAVAVGATIVGGPRLRAQRLG